MIASKTGGYVVVACDYCGRRRRFTRKFYDSRVRSGRMLTDACKGCGFREYTLVVYVDLERIKKGAI